MTFNNTNKRDILIMVNFPNIDKIKELIQMNENKANINWLVFLV